MPGDGVPGELAGTEEPSSMATRLIMGTRRGMADTALTGTTATELRITEPMDPRLAITAPTAQPEHIPARIVTAEPAAAAPIGRLMAAKVSTPQPRQRAEFTPAAL